MTLTKLNWTRRVESNALSRKTGTVGVGVALQVTAFLVMGLKNLNCRFGRLVCIVVLREGSTRGCCLIED